MSMLQNDHLSMTIIDSRYVDKVSRV